MPETRIDEIAPSVFRIATGIPTPDGGGFSFNQYLIAAEQPLLWHTGLRALFETTREAIARVLDPATLRWIGFSHFEADECGALNNFLAVAPNAKPLCGRIGAMVSATDYADKPPRAFKDGVGRKTKRLKDAHRGRLMTTGFQSRLDEKRGSRHQRTIVGSAMRRAMRGKDGPSRLFAILAIVRDMERRVATLLRRLRRGLTRLRIIVFKPEPAPAFASAPRSATIRADTS